jgi:hypothetical protein
VAARTAVSAPPSPTAISLPRDAAELRSRLMALRPQARKAPLLIVNTAINLVSGDDLAWQERKAASFTFTPLHAGSPVVGYRALGGTADTPKCYGGKSGVSLGTAMTISGAAANPNMGYHSSPVVAILLTLFNARLGAWIGNPADPKRFMHAYPRGQVLPMALREAFGLTHARGRYIHLSDGGHFENLGLYELVRRGCRWILVSDAGCDEQYAFEDLGNAVRKIRIDLGIEIEFQGFHVGRSKRTSASAADGDSPGEYVAVGTIYYDRRANGAEKGRLLYVKPALFDKDEPIDVRQYGRAHPAYPHESTADQWFSESQFESYRALGEYIARIVGLGGNAQEKPPGTIEQLFDRADAYLKRRGAVAVTTTQP